MRIEIAEFRRDFEYFPLDRSSSGVPRSFFYVMIDATHTPTHMDALYDAADRQRESTSFARGLPSYFIKPSKGLARDR